MSETMKGQIGEVEREAALAVLLADHPGALISAIDADGLFVAIPAAFDIGEHQEVQARSALTVVDQGSRRPIIETWERAKAIGAAMTPVVLDNGVDATYYFVDLRHRHGVLVGVVVVAADAEVAVATAFTDRAPVVPKTGRIDKDQVAVILGADDRICQILGYALDDLVGLRSLELIHPDDQGRAVDSWMEMLTVPGGSNRVRLRHLRKDGSWLWMEITNTNRLAGAAGRVVTEMIDIADEMAALEEVRQREQLLARLTDALPSGVLHVDRDRRVLYTNARLHQVFGVERAHTLDEQLASVVAEDRADLHTALESVLVDGRDVDVLVRVRLPGDDRLRRCRVATRALTDADGIPAGAVLCVDDVTEATELRAELERRATVDELTGCLNRAAVLDALEVALPGHADDGAGTAVVFLDLDGLKEVNDTYGHRAGDQLLRSVARRLRSAMRRDDLIGRLGGDEFVVVLADVASEGDAMAIGTALADTLAEPPEPVGDRLVAIRASFGVSWARGEGVDPDTLIAAADRAMYESKRAGLGGIVYASV